MDNQLICAPITVTAPSFTIDDVSHSEGDVGTTTYTFTVTKTGSTALSSSVNFTTQDGSATLADNDYQANSGPLNFGPTDTTMQITVLVNGDTNFETNEAFTVHLSGAVNATIADADGTGTITNADSPSISGHVNYRDTTTGVKTITMTLTGNHAFVTRTTTTNSNGDYEFTDVPVGNDYTLTPTKTGDVNHVDSNDSTLVLQSIVGSATLTANQQIAADVDNDGQVFSNDATVILETIVGIPNSGASETWKFNAPSRPYPNLSGNQVNQDFVAFLLGDVDGDWTPPGGGGGIANPGDVQGRALTGTTVAPSTASIPVSLPIKVDPQGSTSTIPITVEDLTGQHVTNYQFNVKYDPTVLQPQNPAFSKTGTLSDTASGMLITANVSTTPQGDTVLRVAAAGTDELTGEGTLLKLKFTVLGVPGSTSPLDWLTFTDSGNVTRPGFQFNNGTPAANPINGSFTVGSPSAANGSVSGRIVDQNGNPLEGAAIRMSGTQNRLTVTDALGNYHFDNVETNGFYTVVPTRSNFTFSPSQRSFSVLGQHTDDAFNATTTGNSQNPLDLSEYFVRQQYVDFLGREPDEAGFNFWYNNIENCGNDANCRAVARVNTSAAFFLSIEFQQTGYLVYRTYRASYGEMPNAPVPLRLAEFKPDTAEIGNGVIVNQTGWETALDNNKQTYMAEFVQRPRFVVAYPTTMTPDQFVDQLFRNAGVTPADIDRIAAIAEFGSAGTSADAGARARALRRVAENSVLARQEFNQAFVLMQYFGYLRRDANSRPDTDFTGYNFWLDKLNTFGGNFQNAEMVRAFLLSDEYRGRFPR